MYMYVCMYVRVDILHAYVVFLTLFLDSLTHRYTTAQAEGLRQNLLDRGYSKVKTYFAMRYWEPYTEDVSTSHAHAHLQISLTHSPTHSLTRLLIHSRVGARSDQARWHPGVGDHSPVPALLYFHLRLLTQAHQQDIRKVRCSNVTTSLTTLHHHHITTFITPTLSHLHLMTIQGS